MHCGGISMILYIRSTSLCSRGIWPFFLLCAASGIWTEDFSTFCRWLCSVSISLSTIHRSHGRCRRGVRLNPSSLAAEHKSMEEKRIRSINWNRRAENCMHRIDIGNACRFHRNEIRINWAIGKSLRTHKVGYKWIWKYSYYYRYVWIYFRWRPPFAVSVVCAYREIQFTISYIVYYITCILNYTLKPNSIEDKKKCKFWANDYCVFVWCDGDGCVRMEEKEKNCVHIMSKWVILSVEGAWFWSGNMMI